MRTSITATLGVTTALLGGVLTATPAEAATTTLRAKIQVCAHGNYTAYAKVVTSTGSAIKLTQVPQGQCWTDSILIDSGAYKVWLFGLYNVSHKGFNVNPYGNQALTNGGATTDPPAFSFEALGTTTSPTFSVRVIK
ncbi:hypothetical protein [Paractinoplanes atraurantiacus]|uniref:DUF2141 domain-containing protein n=1 Tax=Paractinoplanes atraurantiacus TaxID=1036182 RepID=A0A285JKQ6_9ACTN|nr:hypothetical protein [Actinoplanes atraurantiacus]SNY60848.1 hypothetical protein SAMN05421748_1223 [Actinoplanes atraurantiacus]